MIEWQLILIAIFGSLFFLMLTGLPIAFCFMLVNIVGVFLCFGGTIGLEQLIESIFTSITSFVLLPLALFTLMGEVMAYSGIGNHMIDTIDKWLGRLPGRLALLSVGTGTLVATLTGSSLGGIVMMGTVLVPEMERRGYKNAMSLGPILGSGGLAVMIPPSGMAVLLGAIGVISIGKLLIAIVVPGLLMAMFYAIYIIVRCWIQPSIAPSYAVTMVPLLEKVDAFMRYVLPAGFIIFLVVGLIFLGVATPTEAAAMGALGTYILTAAYGELNWEVVKKSAGGALEITVMILTIIVGATAYSQILAFTGASQRLVEFAVGLFLPPIVIIIAMQIVVLFLGMLMDQASIMMITLPIFMPIVQNLGFDPVWFGAIYLLNMEMATTSPPFGLGLFSMKAVAPPHITMGDIYRAALPFLGCDLIVMALMMAFPALTLWLPGLMR